MSKQSLLVGQSLTYTIGTRQLFDNLTISLGREKTGLVGKNGIGKTTLIKILTGNLQPQSGNIYQNCKIGCLPQSFNTYSSQSVASVLGVQEKLKALENVELGICNDNDYEIIGADWDLQRQIELLFKKLELSDLHLDRQIETLSGGETTRVVFASLLLQKTDFLILDEPTNNLDLQAKKALYVLISYFKGGILTVSHDRTLLDLMDQIIELTEVGVKTYGGNYQHYIEQKRLDEQAKQKHLEDAQKFLNKTRKVVQQTREKHQQKEKYGKKLKTQKSQSKMFFDYQKSRSEKTKSKLIQQSERLVNDASENVVKAKQALEKNKTLSFQLENTKVPETKIVVEIKNLTFAYSNNNPIIKSFNMFLKGPKRIAICGPNGSGKTTLLKLIQKELTPTQGIIRIGVENVAYLDQKITVLNQEQTILENFQRLNPESSKTDCGFKLATFLFRNQGALKLVKDLSGGEKLRAALACILMGVNPPQLILLDEPTNNMDIESVTSMENALQNYKGALIAISHDETFLENIKVESRISLK